MLETQNLDALLPWSTLIDGLDEVFRKDVRCPMRQHHAIHVPDGADATLLLMPAWIEGEYLGVKQVNVFPGNSRLGKPALSSHYLLSSATTGELLARFDGNILTARWTAAASALATRYLSRADSTRMLMVGAGRVAGHVVPASMRVRNIEHVDVWSRTSAHAESFVAELRSQGISAHTVAPEALRDAVEQADIISCATLSMQPLIRGHWVRPGTHVDLIGSFTPSMREADDALMARAIVFVDFREAALHESGDLIGPISSGAISASSIVGDFSNLSRGANVGRTALGIPADAMTVFKAVGSAIADLAAAILAYKQRTSRMGS